MIYVDVSRESVVFSGLLLRIFHMMKVWNKWLYIVDCVE